MITGEIIFKFELKIQYLLKNINKFCQPGRDPAQKYIKIDYNSLFFALKLIIFEIKIHYKPIIVDYNPFVFRTKFD